MRFASLFQRADLAAQIGMASGELIEYFGDSRQLTQRAGIGGKERGLAGQDITALAAFGILQKLEHGLNLAADGAGADGAAVGHGILHGLLHQQRADQQKDNGHADRADGQQGARLQSQPRGKLRSFQSQQRRPWSFCHRQTIAPLLAIGEGPDGEPRVSIP